MADEGFQPHAPAPRPAEPVDPAFIEDAPEGNDGLRTLIPYRNPMALLGYYLGVFSMVPCVGALLGPAALVCGILGLRFLRTHPTAKGTVHAWVGIVLGTLATLGHLLLAVIALGAFLGTQS